jgi:hypothetical protein
MSNGSDAHLGTWLVVGVLIGMALALLLGVLAVGVRRARRARRLVGPPPPQRPATGSAPAATRTGPTFAVDDLPGFAERPPGWTAGHWTPSPDSASEHADSGSGPGASPTPPGNTDLGRAGTAAVAVAVLFLVAAVAVAYAGGSTTASARSPDATVTTAPSTSSPLSQPAPAPATETAAAALAFRSVQLGEDGVAASVTFQGVVLEQRPVGLTVTYPSVSLTTDGRRSLAHVRLPTFNCLTAEPPADPLAAGCARSLTEYADLAGPQLQISRDDERIELVGLFPTYTRPNGSAPGYTGRAYQLAATITADGPEHDGQAPAAGVVRIGLDSAPTTADRGVNLLQLPR